MREFAHRGTMSHKTMQRLLGGEPDEHNDDNDINPDPSPAAPVAIGSGDDEDDENGGLVAERPTLSLRHHPHHHLHLPGATIGHDGGNDDEKPMGHAPDHEHGSDDDTPDQPHDVAETVAIVSPSSRPMSRVPSRSAVASKSKSLAGMANVTSSGGISTGGSNQHQSPTINTNTNDGSPGRTSTGKSSRSSNANASSRKPGWGRARSRPVLRMATSHFNLADLVSPLQFAVPPEHRYRMIWSAVRLIALVWYWIASPLRLSLEADDEVL
jgi:hypothetical protein